MNPFIIETTCDVCGGKAMVDVRHAGKIWDGNYIFSHLNPVICRENLRRLKEDCQLSVKEKPQEG